MICSAVLTQFTSVTDRQRGTDRQHIYPTRIASRGGETGP